MTAHPRSVARRRLTGRIATGLCLGAGLLAIFPLFSVLWQVAEAGSRVVTWGFLTELPTSPFSPHPGGILNALVGSLIAVGIGTAIGAPAGILVGTYLAEVGRGRLAHAVRTAADAMSGIPSIVAGLFGFALIVTRFQYSAWAAGVALAVLMLPVVTRTTEEALRTIPGHMREASLALGAPHWYTTVRVVLPQAWGAVATGLLLAVARIAGETAPILLTSIKNPFLVTDPSLPVSTLPTLIYDYSKSAYPKDNAQAQGAALVLIVIVLVVNIAVRLLSRRGKATRQA